MALWGKSDTLASAPKYVTRKAKFDVQSKVSSSADTIDLTNANTNFATGDGVVYTGASGIGLTQGTAYYVIRQSDNTIKLADTEAHAKAGTNAVNLTAGATGAIGYLQRNVEGNEATGASGATGSAHQISPAGDHNYNGRDLYFIDGNEAQQAENRARGLKVPGWTNYRSYTDANGNVRHKSEVLVAMSAYSGATGVGTYQAQTGDNTADDSVLVDATTSISVQPVNRSVTAPTGTTFAVTSTATGAYSSLTYQWQVSSDGGSTWSNLSNAGVYSGVSTATLTISNSTGLNGKKYRVVCGTNTANTNATSVAVTLTVA